MSDIAEKRLELAKDIASKGDVPWDKLTDEMVGAYLHNADCAIAESEAKVTPVPGSKESPFACSVCKDATVIDGKPCQECNPVGLPKAEVSARHAEDARQSQAKKDKAAAAKTLKEAKLVKKEEAVATLKPGQYFCSKCDKTHKESSAVGKQHLSYKVG